MKHRESTIKTYAEIFRKALDTIAARCCESDLSVDDVAAAAFTSPRTLQRAMQHHETSFMAELTATRLRYGMDLLAMRRWPIETIAVGVGFRGHNRFSEAFREMYNVSPREARLAMKLAARNAWRQRQPPPPPESSLRRARLRASRRDLRRLRPILQRLDLDACTDSQKSRFIRGIVLSRAELTETAPSDQLIARHTVREWAIATQEESGAATPLSRAQETLKQTA